MVNMKNKMFIICLMFLLLVGCNKMNEEVPIMSNSNTKIVKSDNQFIFVYSTLTEYKFADLANNIY